MYTNDYPTVLSDFFPVIFDSGSILSISPSCSDVIGSITPIPDIRLGGMENGMIIEGKVIVEWYF